MLKRCHVALMVLVLVAACESRPMRPGEKGSSWTTSGDFSGFARFQEIPLADGLVQPESGQVRLVQSVATRRLKDRRQDNYDLLGGFLTAEQTEPPVNLKPELSKREYIDRYYMSTMDEQGLDRQHLERGTFATGPIDIEYAYNDSGRLPCFAFIGRGRVGGPASGSGDPAKPNANLRGGVCAPPDSPWGGDLEQGMMQFLQSLRWNPAASP